MTVLVFAMMSMWRNIMSFSPTKCWLPEVNHDERHQKRLCHPAHTRDAEWTVHAVLEGHHQALATSLDVYSHEMAEMEQPGTPFCPRAICHEATHC